MSEKPTSFEAALLEARLIAHDPRAKELHVCKLSEEHANGPECWCEPTLFYANPDTGALVYQHRRRQ